MAVRLSQPASATVRRFVPGTGRLPGSADTGGSAGSAWVVIRQIPGPVPVSCVLSANATRRPASERRCVQRAGRRGAASVAGTA